MKVVGFHLMDGFLHWSGGGVFVSGIDLDATDVGVLAVLMVLLDVHLYDPTRERVSIWAAATVSKRDILPANRVYEGHLGKLRQVVVASAPVEDDIGRRV